jgi:hypothetical protein
MTKKVVKGPWKPRPWDDVTADEQMLRMFNTFIASARKKTKQAVFVLLAERQRARIWSNSMIFC